MYVVNESIERRQEVEMLLIYCNDFFIVCLRLFLFLSSPFNGQPIDRHWSTHASPDLNDNQVSSLCPTLTSYCASFSNISPPVQRMWQGRTSAQPEMKNWNEASWLFCTAEPVVVALFLSNYAMREKQRVSSEASHRPSSDQALCTALLINLLWWKWRSECRGSWWMCPAASRQPVSTIFAAPLICPLCLTR